MRIAAKKIAWGIVGAVRDALDPIFNFREVSILCYHSISDSLHDTAVAPTTLEQHMEGLKERGYVFVSLTDVVAWVRGERALPRKAVALTFDDGYADFEAAALPLLKKYKVPAAVFVIGDSEAAQYRTDEQPFLAQEALEGLRQEPLVELGYHSKTHPNLAHLNEGELQREVTPPWFARFFAYPGGGHSPAAAGALRAAGYEAAFTIRPVPVQKGMDCYLLPRVVVLREMSPKSVMVRASRAAQWYQYLKDLL